MELNRLATLQLYITNSNNQPPYPSDYVIQTQGDTTTIWLSDGVASTVQGLGTAGYLSSLYTTMNLDYVSSIVPLTLTADYISTSPLFITTSNADRQAVFSDGSMSTHTLIVYGENTLSVQGSLGIQDSLTNQIDYLYLYNNSLRVTQEDGSISDTGSALYVASYDVISTLDGLATGRYVSSPSLISTTQGLFDSTPYEYLKSTLRGLGTMGYVSTQTVGSTITGLFEQGGLLKRRQMNSTIAGLGTADYTSTASFASTLVSLYRGLNVVSPAVLKSTVNTLARRKYISTQHLVSTYNSMTTRYIINSKVDSTINGLGNRWVSSCKTDFLEAAILNVDQFTSAITGIGNANYLSSLDLASTMDFFFSQIPTPEEVASTIDGLATTGYVSSLDLISTTDFLANSLVQRVELSSTIRGLGDANYVSTKSLASTTKGLFVSTVSIPKLQSTISGLGRARIVSVSNMVSVNTKMLDPSNQVLYSQFTSTIDNLGTRKYISSPSLFSTIDKFVERFAFDFQLTSTVDGLSLVRYLSSSHLTSTLDTVLSQFPQHPDLASTVDGLLFADYVAWQDFTSTNDYIISNQVLRTSTFSTVAGLGSANYISTVALLSSVSWLQSNVVNRVYLRSTIGGIGRAYVSTKSMESTTTYFLKNSNYIPLVFYQSSIKGLGSARYISTKQYSSTMTSLLPGLMLVDKVGSTIDGLGSAQYISSASLTSTLDSYIANYMINLQVASTIDNLSSIGYITRDDFLSVATDFQTTRPTVSNVVSTFGGLRNLSNSFFQQCPTECYSVLPCSNVAVPHGFIEKCDLQSTVTDINLLTINKSALPSTTRGLVFAPYVSTKSLVSTVARIIDPSYSIPPVFYYSSLRGIGSAGYISSASYASTFSNFFSFTIMANQFTSTMTGTGSADYMSTPAIQSSLDMLYSNYVMARQSFSTSRGLGTMGYVSTDTLTFATSFITDAFVRRVQMTSTLNGLGTGRYVSSASLQSTTGSLIEAFKYYPAWDGWYPPYTGIVGLLNITSTLNGLYQAGYPRNIDIASTTTDFKNNSITPLLYLSTVNGLPEANYISPQQNISTTDALMNYLLSGTTFLSTLDAMYQTCCPRYITRMEFFSTFGESIMQRWLPQGTFGLVIQELVIGAAMHYPTTCPEDPGFSYVTQTGLKSTVDAFYYLQYVGCNDIASTVRGLGTIKYTSTASMQSTVSTLILKSLQMNQLQSTINNYTQIGYISSGNLTSTTFGVIRGRLSSPNLISTVNGFGMQRYISTPQITSTVDNLLTRFMSNTALGSTIDNLGNAQLFRSSYEMYNSTFLRQSTFMQYNPITFVCSIFYFVSSYEVPCACLMFSTLNSSFTSNIYVPVSNINFSSILLFSSWTTGNVNYISSSAIQSTFDNIALNFPTFSNFIGISKNLGGVQSYISSLSLVSTTNSFINGPGLGSSNITTSNLKSTVGGLGLLSYVSVSQVTSTSKGWFDWKNTLGPWTSMVDIFSTINDMYKGPYPQPGKLTDVPKIVGNRGNIGIVNSNLGDGGGPAPSPSNCCTQWSDLNSNAPAIAVTLNIANSGRIIPKAPISGFARAVLLSFDRISNINYIAIYYTTATDYTGWIRATLPTSLAPYTTTNGGGEFCPEIRWTGTYYVLFACYNNAAPAMYCIYSSNGSVWYDSGFRSLYSQTDGGSNADQYYNRTLAIKGRGFFAWTAVNAGGGNGDKRFPTRYSIGAYFTSTVASSIQVVGGVSNVITPIRSADTIFLPAYLSWSNNPTFDRISVFNGTTNGNFAAIGGANTNNNITRDATAAFFISWDCARWYQYQLGGGIQDTTMLSIFNSGRYLYAGNCNITNRSIDGSNWEVYRVPSITSGDNGVYKENRAGYKAYRFFQGTLVNFTSIVFGQTYQLLRSAVDVRLGLCNSFILPGPYCNAYRFRSINGNPNQFVFAPGVLNVGPILYRTDDFFKTATVIFNVGGTQDGSYAFGGNPFAVDFSVQNLSFLAYNSPIDDTTPMEANFIHTCVWGSVSSLMNINDSVFVHSRVDNTGSNGRVSFGGILAADYGNRNPPASNPAYPVTCNYIFSNQTFWDSFSTIGTMEVNGLLQTTNTNPLAGNGTLYWVGYSDKRLKQSFKPIQFQTVRSNFESISLYHYKYIPEYISTNTFSDTSVLGFIAQEVSPQFPKAVSHQSSFLGFKDFLTLNSDQIFMNHYSMTQFLMSTVSYQSTLLSKQTLQIQTMNGLFSTLYSLSDI